MCTRFPPNGTHSATDLSNSDMSNSNASVHFSHVGYVYQKRIMFSHKWSQVDEAQTEPKSKTCHPVPNVFSSVWHCRSNHTWPGSRIQTDALVSRFCAHLCHKHTGYDCCRSRMKLPRYFISLILLTTSDPFVLPVLRNTKCTLAIHSVNLLLATNAHRLVRGNNQVRWAAPTKI